jgi:hypothetical protein
MASAERAGSRDLLYLDQDIRSGTWHRCATTRNHAAVSRELAVVTLLGAVG